VSEKNAYSIRVASGETESGHSMKTDVLSTPKVSVIIPTRNSAATLHDCLESTRIQTYQVYEVIVVDNSSTETTINIAERFGAKVLTNGIKPKNASSSRNSGLLNSSGDYVLFLDSDEMLEREVVEECVDICEREGAGMVKIPLRFVGKSFWGSSSAFWRNCHYAVGKQSADNFPRFFQRESIPPGAFNEELDWGEDLDLYMRIKALSVREAYSKSCMIHLEPSSLEEIILKQVRYAEVIPAFTRSTRNKVALNLVRNWSLSLKEAILNPPGPTSSVVGGLIFVCVKTIAVMIGYLQGKMI